MALHLLYGREKNVAYWMYSPDTWSIQGILLRWHISPTFQISWIPLSARTVRAITIHIARTLLHIEVSFLVRFTESSSHLTTIWENHCHNLEGCSGPTRISTRENIMVTYQCDRWECFYATSSLSKFWSHKRLQKRHVDKKGFKRARLTSERAPGSFVYTDGDWDEQSGTIAQSVAEHRNDEIVFSIFFWAPDVHVDVWCCADHHFTHAGMTEDNGVQQAIIFELCKLLQLLSGWQGRTLALRPIMILHNAAFTLSLFW